MHTTMPLSTLLALLLTNSTLAAPTPASDSEGIPDAIAPRAAAATPTCKAKVLTFDELGNSNGKFQSLPGGGYDYFGLSFRDSNFGWVSQGTQYNGDYTEDDRPVTQPGGYQTTNVITHSGTNALMPFTDGFGYYFTSAQRSTSQQYFNPKSLWIAPEIEGKAFNFRLKCEGYKASENRDKTWSVPALAAGQMYQVVIPSDWLHMWRCQIGATGLQQIIIDDFSYCLYEIPNGQTIPW